MSQTAKNPQEQKWFSRDMVVQTRKERKQSEQALHRISNRVGLLQQNQMHLMRQIELHQRSVESKRQLQADHDNINKSRLLEQTRKLEQLQQTQQMNYNKKQRIIQQRRQLQTQYFQQKQQQSEKMKQQHIELQKRIQVMKESQLIKNSMRYQHMRRERMFSQQRNNEQHKDYQEQVEKESRIKLKTEESIKQLNLIELALLSDYQNSMKLKDSLQQLLDPRKIMKIRAKSYEQTHV